MDLTSKINACIALIADNRTPDNEKEAARRLLPRLKAKAEREGQDVSQRSAESNGRYRLPEVEYGAKYTGWLASAELTKFIRADIALARKLGREPSKPGEVKVPDPIGDAPESIKFSVKKREGSMTRSVYVTITGVPADWWITKSHPQNPSYTFRAAGAQLEALGKALKELMWAYNYDGSDAQADYFHRNFYEHVLADGHGEGDYPHDI